MKKNSKSGFTLVELMVVAIIVAVLAAVAIPLMSANRVRAMATEAEAGLGSVRSALRAMFAESGAYNIDLNGNPISAGDPATSLPGIGAGDMNGRFFSEECYIITAVDATTYTLTATGADSLAPQATDVAPVVVTIDESGNITKAGI